VSTSSSPDALPAATPAQWWRNAAIYQVYPRSFADGNGDGTGDLAGVRARLPYLRDLGVDAVWFTPWYYSPLVDGGYDVADYRSIDPAFGTLAEAEDLIAEASRLGVRTIVDIVPNHVSDQHEWFRKALAAGPGSPERERFWFRPGKGEDGSQMPTAWVSSFQGSTWTRTTDDDGTPGEWYLHLFTPQQPDLNWNHPDVRREHEDILRFWFDRGVSGIRIDSAALLVKDPALPEVDDSPVRPGEHRPHPFTDRDELHDVYRSWRAVADSYPEPRLLVGEIWLPDARRFADYLRPDEMHTAFNFELMACPWDATALRASIDSTLAAHALVGAPATWVLSNHDVTRPVTRYGRADTAFAFDTKRFGTPTDLELGTRRARAAALLTAALPGSLYVYQGDELGLPEVEDLPDDARQDPMFFRSGGVDPGRDGCRVPLPWHADPARAFGFQDVPATAPPWLPQPVWWGRYAADAQEDDPGSMLSLYREALAVRRHEPGLRGESFAWVSLGAESGPAPAGLVEPSEPVTSSDLLAFARDDVLCVVNLGTRDAPLPPGELLVASADVSAGRLPPDVAAWLRR